MRWLLSLLFVGCASTPPATGECGPKAVVFVATDYQSTEVGTIERGRSPTVFSGTELGGDPVLATSAGRTFLVARDRDTVFELDRCGHGIATFSTDMHGESKTDPQDLVVLPDGSLLLPRYLVPTAIVLDPHGAPRKTVDLSSYDQDGNPNMAAAANVTIDGKPKALLVIGRLDDSVVPPRATKTGELVVVDAATLAIEGVIDLGARNPFGQAWTDSAGAVWLAAAGDFASSADADAGIVRFDPKTKTAAIVVAETTLGGSTSQIAISADGVCGVAIVADASSINRTWLVTFDPRTGTLGKTVMGPTPGYDLRGLSWLADDSAILVGDRSHRSGLGYPVHVMTRAGTCELSPAEDIMLALPAVAFGR